MQLNRDIDRFLQGADKLDCLVRKKKACHILDADGVCAKVLDSLCKINPVVDRVGIAKCVGQGNLRVSLLLVCRLDCCLQVAEIIQAVEDTDDIDPISDGLLNKVLNNIIRVRAVSQDVLSAEQHLQLRILEACAKLSQPLPRILVEETKGGVKCCTAPALHGVVSDLVHLLDDREHLLGRHTGCNQRLMRVTQDSLSNLDWLLHCFICHCFILSKNILIAEWRISDAVDCHEGTSRDSGTDDTCHVRSHRVHQKEVRRISLRADLL